AQQGTKVEQVELQPLTAQVKRLVEALDYLGAPLSPSDKEALERASHDTDAVRANRAIQDTLDKYCLADIHINPESRVRVTQGAAKAELVEKGWRAFLVKVRNEAGVTAALKAESPNALAVYATSRGNPRPPQRVTQRDVTDRWLDLAMFNKPPLKPTLSGLELEYRIIQLYSRDAGKREAKISFNVGQGTQDIGFRNDVDILFNCQPAVDVTLRVMDERGKPTTASFIIRDAQGFVYPPRTKRLAPDFDFHPQVYRADGEKIKLPAGEYTVEYTRGPEYLVKHLPIKISNRPQTFTFKLERWIDLARLGWYSGDHHVHAAGCMHYESPTEGVFPQDMIRHILGESLNVGSVLTWGPCYYYQKQFFEAKDNQLSTAENLMRYDLEVSGFPSSHCGHLVLLRLKEQDYPGAKVLEDWPTWDLPILQWAKRQGAITGFAHSGWGLEIKDGFELPSYELPKFDGIGANEYIVDVTHDAVDFISTVDTPAPWELNIWYHTLNTGFRTRISGETDFPCIYGERVGLGRSYVKLDKLSYDGWAEGVRDGRTYVSDGKSHLIDFRVNDVMVGTQKSEVKLDKPQAVRVKARVAARLDEKPNEAISKLRYNQKPYWDLERARIGSSREIPVELIVNGQPVAKKNIPADGQIRDLTFDAKIERSSWVALRVPVSSHTNPIFVIVGDKPVRASRRSAEWCLKAVDQCWSQKAPKIAAKERDEAAKAYEHARQTYRRILAESEID
ncbi:MAG: CehA/McbA family metallohydrolase, partial [Acidobacteria bacterium]|nr:CehA/McbA family metallohydrolase [Acidobacteriota bacterium]